RATPLCAMRFVTCYFAAALLLVGCNRRSERGVLPRPTLPPGAIGVTVDGDGYHPAEVRVPANQPTTLVFTRTSDEGGGERWVFPRLTLARDLPLNRPVTVVIPPRAAGRLAFTCGMAMYRGAVVVVQ